MSEDGDEGGDHRSEPGNNMLPGLIINICRCRKAAAGSHPQPGRNPTQREVSAKCNITNHQAPRPLPPTPRLGKRSGGCLGRRASGLAGDNMQALQATLPRRAQYGSIAGCDAVEAHATHTHMYDVHACTFTFHPSEETPPLHTAPGNAVRGSIWPFSATQGSYSSGHCQSVPSASTLFGGFRTDHGVAMTKVGLSAYSLEGSLDAEGALNI